jgi:sulfate/thiosulfate transport system substrate-binding protein
MGMVRRRIEKMRKRPERTLVAGLAAALAALAVLVSACGGSSSDKLSLVAYSTPQEAYQELIPAFQKTAQGDGIDFNQSYGASGDQERAVEAGLKADVVALSLAPDIDKLVKAGKVDAAWDQDANDGFVTDSVVVFATRKGNPKNIKTWDDLIKPGVEVITPNPFTSGGARWNVMAAYGAQLEQGKSKQEALDYLDKLFKNVPVQDKSARESLQTFVGGKGDVLLAYENEAITAQQKNQSLDYVIPDQTILIQNPAAVIKDTKKLVDAKAFLSFLHSPEAQKIYASKGYRPVIPSLVDKTKFPTPPGLFKIDKLGGWSKVNDEFFDPEKGYLVDIEKSKGVPTEK